MGAPCLSYLTARLKILEINSLSFCPGPKCMRKIYGKNKRFGRGRVWNVNEIFIAMLTGFSCIWELK